MPLRHCREGASATRNDAKDTRDALVYVVFGIAERSLYLGSSHVRQASGEIMRLLYLLRHDDSGVVPVVVVFQSSSVVVISKVAVVFCKQRSRSTPKDEW